MVLPHNHLLNADHRYETVALLTYDHNNEQQWQALSGDQAKCLKLKLVLHQ